MEERIITEIKREPFIDENGIKCLKVTYEIKIPRKTYILGSVKGKYRGSLLKISEEFYNSEFYEFEIYEALVRIEQTSKNISFNNQCNAKEFPREKLPELLKVFIEKEGNYYKLGVIEPKICDFYSDKKYHQIEGSEIFGVFIGTITGYIFDYEISYEEVIEEWTDEIQSTFSSKLFKSSGIKTGRSEVREGYIRYEYYNTYHDKTIWGIWEKNKNGIVDTKGGIAKGCFFSSLGIIGFLIVGAVLANFFPIVLYIIGFIIVIWLLNLLAPFLKWIFRGLVGMFLLSLLISFTYNFSNDRSNYIPESEPVETEKELNPVIKPIADNQHETKKNETLNDKIIKHYRIWKDYNGNEYEGYYYIKQSDYYKSGQFKNQLRNRRNLSYDQILYNIQQFDTDNYENLYYMLDSIGTTNKLNKVDFAKMVVSFVQDIPYSLVLQNDCTPSVQTDNFTRNFLRNNQGKCIGNQEFGICTPVEFLYHLKGDCDTRTILLYSIFKHYNYDVAILSSEHYQHSILGINLPFSGSGVAYPYRDKKYYFWETTALGLQPGELSGEFNNLHFWRISLKSK
ncbi:hypothetical protein [Flavobacterium sp. U410]